MATLKYSVDGLELQDRDVAFLRGLFECRVMTAVHVAAVFFGGKREYAKKRLQKIKAVGLVGERERRMNEPSVLFLTRKGFALLRELGELSEYPALGANSFESRARVSDLTLRHELEIMDVKSSFHSKLAGDNTFSVSEFCTWPLLLQFEVSRNGYGSDVLVKPDGFIRILEREANEESSEHTFFLELDRSSETLDTLVSRAVCYLEYFRSGGFAVRNGAMRDQFKDYPFRVLVVLKTVERRNNLAERLAQNNPPIFSQVWLTTLAEVKADPFGPIWIQPGEYRNAAARTPFYNERPRPVFAYRRQPEREAFIENTVPRRRILSDE